MTDFAAFQKLFAAAPAFDAKPLLDAQARNAEAFAKVAEIVSRTARSVAERQVQIAEGNLQDVVAYLKGAFEPKDAKVVFEHQARFAKASAEKGAAQVRELADLTVESNAEILAVLRKRTEEIAAEVKALAVSFQPKAA